MRVYISRDVLHPAEALVSVISDIPLFSAGLMGFGTFTFLTATKRASWSIFLLFAASCLTFGAGMFELSRTLAEMHGSEVSHASRPLEIIRDVALALCTGLVYLFMWLFVAECPQIEAHTCIISSQLQSSYKHSGRWSRCGVLGEVTKSLSLSLSLLVPVLRIIWHQLEPLAAQGVVLIADATIEIVLSMIFILKLLINASLVPGGVGWKALRDYIAPIVAMIISASLASSNLTTISQAENGQAFTDNTIGRFLLATQLYILLLFALINAFYQDISRFTASANFSSQSEKSAPSTWIGPRREGCLDLDSLQRARTSQTNSGNGSRSRFRAIDLQDNASRQLQPPSGYRGHSPHNSATARYASLTTLDRILHHKIDLDRAIARLRTLSDEFGEPSPSTSAQGSTPKNLAPELRYISNEQELMRRPSVSELLSGNHPSTSNPSSHGLASPRLTRGRDVTTALEEPLHDVLGVPTVGSGQE